MRNEFPCMKSIYLAVNYYITATCQSNVLTFINYLQKCILIFKEIHVISMSLSVSLHL